MRSDFIDDGYTESGFIPADPGRHGELTFEFRPACGEVRSRLVSLYQNQIEFDKQAVIGLAKHLLSWSLTDGKGSPVKITADNLWKVKGTLRAKLVDIVFDFAKNEAADGASNRAERLDNDLKN